MNRRPQYKNAQYMKRQIEARKRAIRRRNQRRKFLRACLLTGIFLIFVLLIVLIVKYNSNTKNDESSTDSAAHVMNYESVTNDIQKVICIDPGHGYDDVGTSSDFLGNVTEKEVTLDIALRLKDLLEKSGYKVLMTRDSDTPPSNLSQNSNGSYLFGPPLRVAYANSNDIDLYISVHCNSFPEDSTISGTRFYYYKDNSELTPTLAVKLANAVQNKFGGETPMIDAMSTDDAYAVIRLIEKPSVLVETGFVTNAGDAAKMLDTTWKQDMATALAEGIDTFFS